MIEPSDIETRQPYPGESLYGLIAAVTADNDLVRIGLIAGAADRKYGHFPQLKSASREELLPLSQMLEVGVDDLVDRSYQLVEGDPSRRTFFGTTVARGDVRPRTRFFSPAALAKHPFHRAMWQLRIPFDTETGEILVCRCPHCGRIQRWRHSAGIECCDGCGDSLDQTTGRIDDAILPEVALAVGLTHTDPARRAESLAMLPAEIAGLGAATAYEMLLRLVPVAQVDCTWSTGDRLWGNRPHDIALGMRDAWRLMLAWPQAMSDRISQDLTTSATRHSDGNRGETVRFLRLRHLDYIPHDLRDLVQRFHESIDTAGPNGAALRATTMTSVEVSKVLGHGTAQIVALRRRGAFRTIGAARGPLMVPVFDRAEVMAVERHMRQRRDLDRANGLLGLPYYAVEQLSALGRLPLLTHPFFSARYSEPQTTADAIDDLIAALTVRRSPTWETSVPILDAMHMVGGRLKPWDAVIEAMLAGGLRFSLDDGNKALFGRVRVERDDLRPQLAMHLTRDGAATPLSGRTDPDFPFLTTMTKMDAAEVLNLAVKQATKLLSVYPTTNEPVVPIADVNALADEHITNTEIAAKLGIPHQTVRSAARSLGIRRVSEAGYDRTQEAKIVAAVRRRASDEARASKALARSLQGRKPGIAIVTYTVCATMEERP